LIFAIAMFLKYRRRLRELKNLHFMETKQTFKRMKGGRWGDANRLFHRQFSTKRAIEKFLRLKKK